MNLVNNSASMGVTAGSTITATNNQIKAQTQNLEGLIVNNGGSVSLAGVTSGAAASGLNIDATGNTVTLLNSMAAQPAHGLTIGPTSTVLSGGTTSTTLTLDNSGATFSSNGGAPARVTGVANGGNQYDAVNFGQLQKVNIGVASVSALAAIPSTIQGKKFAIGAGYGYFENESAVAIGLKASIFDSLSVTAGVGFGVGRSDSTYSANAGFSFIFNPAKENQSGKQL